MTPARLLATNAAWSLIAHLLARGSLVVASMLLARTLDTSSFAAYSYFQLTASMLAAYSALGLGTTASKFFAETNHVSKDRTPPVGTLWALSMIAGLILALLIMSLPDAWVDSGLEFPRWLLSLGVFVMALGVVPAGGVLGLERYREATTAAAVAAGVVVLGSFIAGTVGSAVWAMWVFILGSLVQAAGNALVVVRTVGARRLLALTRFGRLELRRIAGFAGPMMAVTLLSASGAWIVGRIILAGPSGQHGFSLYVIGLQWFSLALLLPGMISRVVLPRLVRGRLESPAGSLYRESTLVRRGAYMTLASALTTCVIGAILSPWLWSLYGVDYAPGAWLIIAFMLAAVPAAPANTLGNAILADNGQMEWLLITSAWFIGLILLTTASVSLGVWSGAIAHGFAYTLMILLVAKTTLRRSLI